jgi:hypothetical protein
LLRGNRLNKTFDPLQAGFGSSVLFVRHPVYDIIAPRILTLRRTNSR